MIEESIEVGIILGGEAQTDKIEDSTVLTDMRGGTSPRYRQERQDSRTRTRREYSPEEGRRYSGHR